MKLIRYIRQRRRDRRREEITRQVVATIRDLVQQDIAQAIAEQPQLSIKDIP